MSEIYIYFVHSPIIKSVTPPPQKMSSNWSTFCTTKLFFYIFFRLDNLVHEALQYVAGTRRETCVYLYGGYCDLTRKTGPEVSLRFRHSQEGVDTMETIIEQAKSQLKESPYVKRVVFCELVNGNIQMWNNRKLRLDIGRDTEEQMICNDICLSTNSVIRRVNGHLHTPHLSNVCKRVKNKCVSWRWGVFRDGVHLHCQDKVVQFILVAYERNKLL